SKLVPSPHAKAPLDWKQRGRWRNRPHDVLCSSEEEAVSGTTKTVQAPEDLTFRPSTGTSLGVELELQILDRESGDLAPGAVRLLQACREEGIDDVSAELHQSMIEVKTGVCQSVAEVQRTLVPLLRRVRNLAGSLGYDLAFGGTHPFNRT